MTSSSSQLGQRTLKGTIRVFLAEALILPTGLLTAIFLTRWLGPEGYGLFTLAATVVSWIEWSTTSIFSRTTIKFVSEADDWRPVGATVLRQHLAISAGAALLLWLLAAPIAKLLGEPRLTTYLPLFALEIPLFSLASAHRTILIGLGGFGQQAIASASRWFARLLLMVLLVWLGLSIWGALLGSVGASLVELIISRFFVRPDLFRRSSFPARQLWGYAVPLFLFALSMRLYDKLDFIALKVLGGTTAQAGIYGTAQNLSLVPGIFALSFAPLLLSTLIRACKIGDIYQAREIGREAMRVVFGLLPFAAMTAGAAPEIIGLIFGPPFMPAAPLLAVLIFGAIAQVMISVTTAIMIAAGKPTWTFAVIGPLLPLAVIGHLLVIPQLGAIGASVVTTLFASLGALVTVLAVYRIWQILPPYRTLIRSILVCGLAYALAAYWFVPGFWLLLKLLAIALVIPLAFLLLGEFSASEIALVRSMVRFSTVSSEKSQNPREF